VQHHVEQRTGIVLVRVQPRVHLRRTVRAIHVLHNNAGHFGRGHDVI
jgi:hypothetical protein